MLWLKAFHIVLVVSWFAGLFYLPRIFVNHAMAEETAVRERLKLMERKLYKFVTPIGALAVITGLWLWFGYGFSGGWLHVKTALVAGWSDTTSIADIWLTSSPPTATRAAMSGSASSTKCRCWCC